MSNPELQFLVQDVDGSDDWRTERPGFIVTALDPASDQPLGHAEIFDGYYLGTKNSEELIEPDVLHVQFVQTATGPLHGVGTAIMRKAMQEGAERGFTHGRADAAHPRMVGVLAALATEGTIQNLAMYDGKAVLKNSGQLQVSANRIDAIAAKGILLADSDPRFYQGASRHTKIRTLFSI